MGINPTQSNFKSFTFDGVNSRQYGVYITGAGVFNAPERNVEMLDIAGRNGAFVLDKGSFLNIEVTYPASIACDNETDFAEAVSDLRNLLCSKVGYVRLEDDYNPNEYRLAIYKSGLEVSHDFLIAGEFDLVFECKPQRYLKSGETAISVTSGDTITNPTRFDAQPQLEIEGYGNINCNGYNIELFDDLVGNVMVETQATHSLPYFTYLGNIYVNANDVITFNPTGYSGGISFYTAGLVYDLSVDSIDTITKSNVQISGTSLSNVEIGVNTNGAHFDISCFLRNVAFSAFTEQTITVSFECIILSTNGITYKSNPKIKVYYDGANSISYSFTGVEAPPFCYISVVPSILDVNVQVQSTATTYGHPTYIDCETGEAYAIKNDVAISLGKYVSLGSELPVLANGANTITYDNTITSLKITPRWWKV